MNKTDKVIIVHSQEIPTIESVETPDGIIQIGQLAEFRKHPKLRELMPETKHHVSFAWTMLLPYQELPVHKHPIDSMIIICEGSGSYFGEFDASLKAGDIVYVTSNALHGFKAGASNLRCLSIQFENHGLYSNKHSELVNFGGLSPYDKLLQVNNLWAESYLGLCKELRVDYQKHGSAYAAVLFGQLSKWSTVFQNILYIRQAQVSVPEIGILFKAHLIEEFGHDAVMANYSYQWCTELEGYFSWFINQMSVLCDYRKLILVHMVLETASSIFSISFKDLLKSEINLEHYIDIHYEFDQGHSVLGAKHVLQYCQQNYALAKEICDQGWEVFIALFKCIRSMALSEVLKNAEIKIA